MRHDLSPYDLVWTDVAPARHPFDPAGAARVVAGLAETHPVPVRTVTPDLRTAVDRASREGQRWADTLTEALVDRYGPWALGWRRARDEGDIGGGPVRSWCCASHWVNSCHRTRLIPLSTVPVPLLPSAPRLPAAAPGLGPGRADGRSDW